MRGNLMKGGLLFSAVAAVLTLAACENVGPTQPGLQLEPEVKAVYSSSGQRFVVVKEKDLAVNTVTGVIGSGGGKLVLGKHELVIPRDAVSSSTTFSLTKLDLEHLQFKLTATRLLLNDVGSAGFHQPVTLTVSFENAASLPEDLNKLKIVWIRPDGVVEIKESTLNVTGHRVSAGLDHFSEYALVHP